MSYGHSDAMRDLLALRDFAWKCSPSVPERYDDLKAYIEQLEGVSADDDVSPLGEMVYVVKLWQSEDSDGSYAVMQIRGEGGCTKLLPNATRIRVVPLGGDAK